MIQTKLINILKKLPKTSAKTSAKSTEKIVNREAKSVEKVIDTLSDSERSYVTNQNAADLELDLSEEEGSDSQIDESAVKSFKDSAVFDKKDKRFTYKDKVRKDKKLKKKYQAISKPTPTAPEYAMYLQYNKKGIFLKTNLKELNNRDKNGSVIINIGDK